MTRYDPSLILSRLVIESNGFIVYDESFHAGLNIIRGENSAGKSTILNFIFYGLGGDLSEWSEAARRCTRVFVEVELSGKSITLCREVSETSGQPMDTFGGPFALAQRAPRSDWIRYPYRRSDSRESFSQAIFRLLEIPEVRNEVSGNVTIHQILRLLYADQLSPIDELFRSERFDSALLRDVVGRLLCGAYDTKLYENELRLRELDKELEGISGELRSLFAVVGRSGEGLTQSWVDAERSRIISDQGETQQKIEEAERLLFSAADMDIKTRTAQDSAYVEVQKLQELQNTTKYKRDALAMEIADSDRFLKNLEEKLVALADSSSIASSIGNTKFRFCPACHAPVNDDHPEGHCHLCTAPIDPERAKARITSQINETALQIKQSKILQEARKNRLDLLERELEQNTLAWQLASMRLREFSRLPSTEIQDRLRKLQRHAGYLDRQMEELNQRAKAVDLVAKLSAQKEALSIEIARLRAASDGARMAQQSRFEKAKSEISSEILNLLKNDLRREEAFENPQSTSFDFGSNRISVDGQNYFSASSRAILKSSFAAGFLYAAAKDKAFRHPRFCMIDTVEDKGMEPDRSRNFQIVLARQCETALSEHQIIIATAMIAPGLDDERYTVGSFATRDEPTLRFPKTR